ncbi:hypothetical protein [Halostella litorea]|uniref:hypothetical protein n=1 Tax=Halostella litorea TaxID=2528831 RepID=UPI00138744D1|nr:hypothetical protein [Halostella litorea]
MFERGDAPTLCATIPARLGTDSQFPFPTDDAVRVTTDNGRLGITPAKGDAR